MWQGLYKGLRFELGWNPSVKILLPSPKNKQIKQIGAQDKEFQQEFRHRERTIGTGLEERDRGRSLDITIGSMGRIREERQGSLALER